MKYCLISWTATYPDGQSLSGNATMTAKEGLPSQEAIIEMIKTNNPKFKECKITLQDQLEFNSREELESYGRV